MDVLCRGERRLCGLQWRLCEAVSVPNVVVGDARCADLGVDVIRALIDSTCVTRHESWILMKLY